MKHYYESYVEHGGKWSGTTTHELQPNALVLEVDELARAMKSLRRGNAEDKKLVKKMFKFLTGFKRCKGCGRLARHFACYYRDGRQFDQCQKCEAKDRLRRGWSISKDTALSFFSKEEYRELAEKHLERDVFERTMMEFYNASIDELVSQDVLDCM